MKKYILTILMSVFVFSFADAYAITAKENYSKLEKKVTVINDSKYNFGLFIKGTKVYNNLYMHLDSLNDGINIKPNVASINIKELKKYIEYNNKRDKIDSLMMLSNRPYKYKASSNGNN